MAEKNLVTFCCATIQNKTRNTCMENMNLILKRGQVMCLMGLKNSGEAAIFNYFLGNAEQLDGEIIIAEEAMEHGEISLRGRAQFFWGKRDEMNIGNLNVMEYLMLISRERLKRFLWNEKEERRKAEEALTTVGLDLPVTALCRNLKPIEKRILYLTRGMLSSASIILIQDEYEDLTEQEMKQYRCVLKDFCDRGLGFFIETNNIRFAAYLADITCVFKDFRIMKKVVRNSQAYDTLQAYLAHFPGLPQERGKEGAVNRYHAQLTNASDRSFAITAKAGEIVLLKVRDTKAQFRFFDILSGYTNSSLRISLDGKSLFSGSQRVQFRHKIVSIRSFLESEEMFPSLSAGENLMLPNVMKLRSVFKLRKKQAEVAMLQNMSKNIEADPTEILMERWRIFSPKVIILQNPFLNVDYENRMHIGRWMNELAYEGTAILIISPDEYDYREIVNRVVETDGRYV